MKFTVTFKDPDRLNDALARAVRTSTEAIGLDEDEREAVMETRRGKLEELCGKWFQYGEYLRVEIDTEAKTATVLPVA